MGSTNRQPAIEREARAVFERVSKADWAELYRDLYRQTHGETSGLAWVADVTRRLGILQAARTPTDTYPTVQPQPQTLRVLSPVIPTATAILERPVVAPASTGFVPSRYQQAIFDFIRTGRGDGLVNAVAGSGKTTTLVQAARLVQEPALFCAFNKHIADELQTRLAGTAMIAKTIHSIGNTLVTRALGKTRIEAGKYRTLVRDYVKANIVFSVGPVQDAAIKTLKSLVEYTRVTLTDPHDHAALLRLVDHFGVEADADQLDRLLAAVPEIIAQGLDVAKSPEHLIDFTDMLYLPYVWKLQPATARWVFVDEAQDLNAAQLDLVLKLRAPQGRMIFVGDRNQAIYGFAGADAESFDNIQRRTGAVDLPLSICYRCPTSVLDLARTIVPQIEAAPGAPTGAVTHVPSDDLATQVQAGDLILCRKTAPLMNACLRLIGARVAAKVRGRDVGAQLVETVAAVVRMPNYGWVRFADALGDYQATQTAKLNQREGNESRIEALSDRCEAVRTCYEGFQASDAAHLSALIEGLFSDERATVTLSTVHKAKGLENGRVLVLQPECLPLVWQGQQDWEAAQERNLQYVAYTRPTRELIFLDA